MERVEICGWVDHVRWGLGGRVAGEDCVGGNSDSPWWRPGRVGRSEEWVGFLEEVRGVSWHKGKVRGRCGKGNSHGAEGG